MAMIYRSLLLVGIVLTARLCACKVHGDGFSVEMIHRDSVKSPYHDPALSAHARALAAVRRSTARAAALARSYIGNGVVSEVFSKHFEFLMVVHVGTPPTRMLAIVDTGSNLVLLKCKPRKGPAAPSSVVFDPSSSSTFGRVLCYYDACIALFGTFCDVSHNCQYHQSYADGSETSGLLSTETFTFDSVPGGCLGCRDHPEVQVPNVNFGCSTSASGTLLIADGLIGLGPRNDSLIGQLGIGTSLGRRFSYCMAPYFDKNATSALNFGDRAVVTEPGAAITSLIHSNLGPYYTIVLLSVKIGSSSFEHLSNIIVDTGTTLTFLDKELIDQIVKDLWRRIALPTVQPPEKLLQLCYSVSSFFAKYLFLRNVPDVTLYLAGFGETVTLKAENTFFEVQEGIMCLAMTPVTEQQPVAILGNIAQQNMHVGYDLHKGTVTFAPADCASSFKSAPVLNPVRRT